MKLSKCLFSVLLAVVMILGVVPSAFATETNSDYEYVASAVDGGSDIATYDMPSQGYTARTSIPMTVGEFQVLLLANKARISNGAQPLSTFSSLQDACDVRAAEIIDLFSHDRPNGTECFTVLGEYGINYNYAGENIAYGYGSASSVHNGWMNSDGHRKNILNEQFTHMGVGLNTSRWVQLFTMKNNTSYKQAYVMYVPSVNAGTNYESTYSYLVLDHSYYGECYMPVCNEFITGYDPEVVGVQNVKVNALGFSWNLQITVTPPTELENVVVYKTQGHSTGNILYWNAVEYGDVYQVYRLNGSSWELLSNTRGLAYKDTTATPGVRHYYKIVARNGESKSNIQTTTSVSVIRPGITSLNNVTITGIDSYNTGNIIYWNAVTNAKLYQVYRLDGSSWKLLTNTGSTTYKDESAPVGVKCYYKIVARNGEIKSNLATTVSASATRPALANVVINKTIGHSTGNILYWNAVNNADLYQVYRLHNGKWELLANTRSLGYKDTGASVGTKCYYKVVARNGKLMSNIASTTSTGVVRAS